jgi:hypothetical protein
MWTWLYENPTATAENLRDAVLKIAKNIWNTYFYENFGQKDCTILAVYSHQIMVREASNNNTYSSSIS